MDPVNPADAATSIPSWLWIAFTLAAAGAQTLRNAAQRELTATLGTVGATHVRFLFGLPFAALGALAIVGPSGGGGLSVGATFWGWIVFGALAQILATAWMLAAMRDRAFVVATAYVKTEPVQVAVFALVFLGERLSARTLAAILIATVGVMLMSWPRRDGRGVDAPPAFGRSAWIGLASGGMFALAAVGFRAAVGALGEGSFVTRASFTVFCGLAVQTALLSVWLAWRDRAVLVAIARAWRPSLWAGFLGAFASQMWFLAFALEQVARVRTLGLVELLFAQMVGWRMFAQRTRRRELAGIALVAGGVLLLL